MQSFLKNLKVGSLVEIEVMSPQNEIVKLKTIVEEVINESELKLFAPIYKGTTFPFRLKQGFTLITVFKHPISREYDIYSSRCRIIQKERDGNISTLTIKKTSVAKKVQRRNFFRLPLIKNMIIKYNDNEYELLSRDLSGNGIRGYISKKIPAESEAVLLLEVDDETTLEINLKVVECNPDSENTYRFDFRAAFINLKNKQMSCIMKYIFGKQAESIKKQLDFNEYVSIIDSDKTYSDFFSMSNVEKITRAIPIALWSIMLIQYAYLMSAFRDRNMGINFFFNQIKTTFKPEFLEVANSFALIAISIASLMLIINLVTKKRTHLKFSISLLLQILLSIPTIIIYQIYS